MRLRRNPTEGPSKPRLSMVRIAVAAALLAGGGVGTTRLVSDAMEPDADTSGAWFAPYVDVTLPPYLDFQDAAANPNLDVVLAFVVAGGDEPCEPSWGAAYDLDAAGSELDLDRRIVRLRERGGDVVVSFGGVANDELASVCTDPDALAEAYRSVVDRYRLTTIDLDIEGAGLDADASARRAEAIAEVQSAVRDEGGALDVWVTVPVAPTGMTDPAVAVVDDMLAAGVDLAGVNVMTMDYGESRPATTDFVSASLQGIDAASLQVTAAYRRRGVELTAIEAYAKIGVTPMIGQNDVAADRLDVDGGRALYERATSRGVERFSMWSLNRDAPCPGNVDPAIADNRCSGVDQVAFEFSLLFGRGDGRPTTASAQLTAATSGRVGNTDPATGPHAQWRLRREYEEGAKVVWQGDVYVAKWWNVDAQPDAPVENAWDSPWRVLGPVLPEDLVPSTSSTLPDGTYPAWTSADPYEPGDRVQRHGLGFRAKWWNRGEDPQADVDNEWESAWEPVGAPEGGPSEAGPGPDGGDDAPGG